MCQCARVFIIIVKDCCTGTTYIVITLKIMKIYSIVLKIMPMKMWVNDPQSGGTKIPDSIQPRIHQRILSPDFSQDFAATSRMLMSTALHLNSLLNILTNMPASPVLRAPCIHEHLRGFATKSCEKSGLTVIFSVE